MSTTRILATYANRDWNAIRSWAEGLKPAMGVA